MHRLCHAMSLALLVSASAQAQVVVPGADGSDGALNVTANQEIALAAAPTMTWNAPNPNPGLGRGVYDPDAWAVVFRYSSVNISSGRTLTFSNHPSRAPVVWLVSGDVHIGGTVQLSGQDCVRAATVPTEPGPGGFRGGIACNSSIGSSGLGPGGGRATVAACSTTWLGAAGSFGSVGGANPADSTYGSPLLRPLIGGSGSSHSYAFFNQYGGAGGGGAILIAATGSITINGSIVANGGACAGASGAGGAIRLVSSQVVGTGQLRAIGLSANRGGGNGRIRIETNSLTLTNIVPNTPPQYSQVTAPATLGWIDPNAPSVRIVSVGGIAVPTGATARVLLPNWDVFLRRSGGQQVVVETRNLPLNSLVKLRVVPLRGLESLETCTHLSGDATLSRWTAVVQPGELFSIIQATAALVVVVPQSPNAFSSEVSIYRGCAADYDDGSDSGTPDGGVTIDDILYYVRLYGDGDVDADLDDGSGTGTPDGGVTIDDLLYYLVRFEAGC